MITVTIPVAVDALTVNAAVPSALAAVAPRSSDAEPEIFIVVACVAVNAVRTLLVPDATRDKVSTPKTDWVPDVMFDNVTVAESAEPVTSLKVMVWACAESDKVTATAFPIPVTVAPPTPLCTVREVVPVALAMPKVAAAVLVMVTLSMLDSKAGVTEPVMVAMRESVPLPPESWSPVVSVWTLDDRLPSKESLPELPVNMFVTVVSGQVARKKIIF